jgi:hypothetical protein
MAKKQPKTGVAPGTHTAGVASGGGAKDPCKHKNNRKKRKYVVYIAPVVAGNPPQPTGEMYVGRTQGLQSELTDTIVLRRMRGHHRRKSAKKRKKLKKIGDLIGVCVTESYAAVRGAEQKHMDYYRNKTPPQGSQMNGISPDNPRRQDYMDCAEQKNGANCDICGGTA